MIELSSNLFEFAKEQKYYNVLVKIYLLKSKLALLEFKIVEAREEINKAMNIAKQFKLTSLLQLVNKEYELISSGTSFWLNMKNKNSSLKERIEQSHITLFLRTKGSSRGAIPDF